MELKMRVVTTTKTVQDQRTILQAFSRALTRESHVLRANPEMLWGQMANRLLGEPDVGQEGLAPSLAARRAESARPWVRLQSPYPESAAFERTLIGHEAEVRACAFSPDGRTILSAGLDRTMRLWDACNGQLIRTFAQHQGIFKFSDPPWIVSCAFSPDGRQALSAGGKSLQLSQTGNGRLLQVLQVEDELMDCGFSPDGRWIAAVTLNGHLKIWRASTGAVHLAGKQGSSAACAFSPDGNRLVTGYGDHLLLLDVPNGKPIGLMEGHTAHVLACAFAPHGRFILSVSKDCTACLWETATCKVRFILEGHTDAVLACAFSPDGSQVATAGFDRTIRLWDAATGKLQASLGGHSKRVLGIDYSLDGAWIVSASADRTLKVWDLGRALRAQHWERHQDGIQALAFSPDGRQYASAGKDHTLVLWDTATWKAERRLAAQQGALNDCGFSPDGKTIVTAGEDGTLQIWGVTAGRVLKKAALHTGAVLACHFSPDGSTIVSRGLDKTVRCWDIHSGATITRIEYSGDSADSRLSPDGSTLFLAGSVVTAREYDEDARMDICTTEPAYELRDILTGKQLVALGGYTGNIRTSSFSPDGRMLAAGGNNADLVVWEVPSGKVIHVLSGHSSTLSTCAFSPDQSILATGGWDHIVNVWDVASGDLKTTVSGHTKGILALSFSPDGEMIFTAATDGTVCIWQAASGVLLVRLALPNDMTAFALHPWAPIFVSGDSVGNVYPFRLEVLRYGPHIVTAAQSVARLALRCPACRQAHPVSQPQLGTIFTCPNPACGLDLRLNPFTIGMK